MWSNLPGSLPIFLGRRLGTRLTDSHMDHADQVLIRLKCVPCGVPTRGSVVVMEKTLLLVASTTPGVELEAAAARQDNALLLTLQNEIKRSRHTDLNSLIRRSPLGIPSISLQHGKSREGEEIYLPCEYRINRQHFGQHFAIYVWTTNEPHLPEKRQADLDAMQSQWLHRMCFGQYQAWQSPPTSYVGMRVSCLIPSLFFAVP